MTDDDSTTGENATAGSPMGENATAGSATAGSATGENATAGSATRENAKPDGARGDGAKGPLGQAIDTFVYAPIGLFFDAPTLLPKLVTDGKNHAKGARVFGEFAVRHGRAELQRRLSTFEAQAGEVLRTLGVLPDDEAEPPGPPGSGLRADTNGDDTRGGAGAAAARTLAGGNGATADDHDAPAVDTLAITDYDSLSASQVVTRLDGLEPDELEAVRSYESAHRGRKTILNKVAQIQA